MSVISGKYAKTGRDTYAANAIYVAEAGVSDTINRLNSNPNFLGYPDGARIQFYNDGSRGKAEYSTIVTNNSLPQVTIESTGYMYRKSTDSIPYLTKKLKVQVKKSQTSGSSNFIVGAGGVTAGQFTSIMAPDMYIKGKLRVEPESNTGTASEVSNIYVENIGCGNATNWPQPCGVGSEPITTSTYPGGDPAVYGTVCATNQVNPIFIFPGSSGKGLVPGCVAPNVAPKPFDKQAFIAGMNAASKVNGSSIQCVGGVVTIPANTWVVGNINISAIGPSDCTLIIGGDVYIEGNLEVGVYGLVKIADSVTTPPKIVMSGKYKIGNAFASAPKQMFKANSSGVKGYVISFDSTNATCSGNVNVPSATVATCLTPSEAMASAQMPAAPGNTVTGAMICTSGGNHDMSGAILYAYYGIVNCGFGGMTVAGLASQGVYTSYDTELRVPASASQLFADLFGTDAYVVTDYRQVY